MGECPDCGSEDTRTKTWSYGGDEIYIEQYCFCCLKTFGYGDCR